MIKIIKKNFFGWNKYIEDFVNSIEGEIISVSVTPHTFAPAPWGEDLTKYTVIVAYREEGLASVS